MLKLYTKVVAFSFFEPMSEKEARRDGVKGLERREDMIRRNYFTGIRYVRCKLRARARARSRAGLSGSLAVLNEH